MMRLTTLVTLAFLAGCVDTTTGPAPHDDLEPSAAVTHFSGDNFVDATNALLEAAGSDYRIAYVEYLTNRPSLASKNIIISRDLGNKRLTFDFIPNDPRRGGFDGDPNTIDVWIDLTQGATSSGLSAAETTDAIVAAMLTWDAESCSELGTNLVPIQMDLGLVQSILGFGGGPAVPDVMHAGWLPPAFFDLLIEDGSSFILGATFTLTFAEGDLNADGLPDLAAREIYYNDAFAWGTSGTPNLYDVETIALHEAGHGLSQGHFGTIRFNPNSGNVIFSPRAVMNAVYSGVNRDLDGTDKAGHCGLWGHWPEGNGVL
jgi:hypothetical protein